MENGAGWKQPASSLWNNETNETIVKVISWDDGKEES
jgi:hypothetical protein